MQLGGILGYFYIGKENKLGQVQYFRIQNKFLYDV